MTEQEDSRRKSRRDLLLVLLILPLAVLCMFVTGQAAIKLAPTWILQADMGSYLDPNADFAAQGNQLLFEPLNPNILTQPAWGNLFLTPQAFVPTRVIVTKLPTPVNTPPPPPVINTPVEKTEPTATPVVPISLPTRGGPPLADLTIEKSDNSQTYTPGTAINYTIIVTNLGPDDAAGFDVTDTVPAVITGLTTSCTPAARCGTNLSNGNNISYTGASLFYAGVNQITISVSGTVASGATGDLSNTANVVVSNGARYRDPYTSNNTAMDTDSQLSVYDLAITKTDGVDTYTATAPINYTVVVTNNGPSDALGISITDNLPPQIASWTWACSTVINASGCDGVASSTANFTDTVDIRLGGNIVYTVTAFLAAMPQNPQNLSNTANIILPVGFNIVDPDLSNNSATDVDIPYIDLQITKDDGVSSYQQGGILNYTVTVTNNSTFNLNGVTVADTMPPLIAAWTWTCTPVAIPPGASCATPSGTGDVNEMVNLPAGASIVYAINATVSVTATGELSNTAAVSPPAGYVDQIPGNDMAIDTDNRYVEYVSSPPDMAGPPDNVIGSIATGNSLDFLLTTPITIDGNNSDYEIVFYEWQRPGNIIELDQIIISIGDGTNWYPVYYWGDNIADLNASPPGSTSEPDNFPISTSLLYGSPYQTGILINTDGGIGAPPNGTYQYIRVTAPNGDVDGGCDIDAIGVWP